MAEQHVSYDGCDAVLTPGNMWVFQCGFMVHDRAFMRELPGHMEEALATAHRRHHENSIGSRMNG